MIASQRKPRLERRQQIADTALAIIGRQGLSALTTAALAKEIGLTSGALFRHFASREAILEEAVRRAEVRVDATFPDADLPPTDRLRRLARARIRLLSKDPGLVWLLRSEEALLALPQAAVDRLRGLAARSRAFIQAAIKEASAQGALRADLAPDVLLLTFTATVHALIQGPGLHGRPGRRVGSDRMLDGLFTLLAPPRRTPTRS